MGDLGPVELGHHCHEARRLRRRDGASPCEHLVQRHPRRRDGDDGRVVAGTAEARGNDRRGPGGHHGPGQQRQVALVFELLSTCQDERPRVFSQEDRPTELGPELTLGSISAIDRDIEARAIARRTVKASAPPNWPRRRRQCGCGDPEVAEERYHVVDSGDPRWRAKDQVGGGRCTPSDH